MTAQQDFEAWWKGRQRKDELYVPSEIAKASYLAAHASQRVKIQEAFESCAVIAENFSTSDGYEIAHKIREQARALLAKE